MSIIPDPRNQLSAVSPGAGRQRSSSAEAYTPLSVTVVRRVGALVLVVSGEVDSLTAPRLSQAVSEALREHPPLLVVDLSAVTFLSCAGLSVLVMGHQRAEGLTRLRVVATTRPTLRPLQLTGLVGPVAVHSSREDALATP
jgi:anti-anti-sigma factor